MNDEVHESLRAVMLADEPGEQLSDNLTPIRHALQQLAVETFKIRLKLERNSKWPFALTFSAAVKTPNDGKRKRV